MEFNYKEELKDYLPVFMEAFEERLKRDKLKWGDTWKHRPKDGQEERFYNEMMRYFDQYDYGGMPMPYLKVIGNAFICWVREYEKEQAEKATDVYCAEYEED